MPQFMRPQSERAMTNSKPFFARFSLPILMAFGFATPLLIQGAQKAVKSNTNKVQDWLPKTFRETTELRWFRQHFMAGQFVLISWDGCTRGDTPDRPAARPARRPFAGWRRGSRRGGGGRRRRRAESADYEGMF